MASSFLGLYVQRDALQTAQKSLDIVGNNISNIETKGYTRQRVDVASIQNSKSSLIYNTSVTLAGQGIETVGVAQVRDALLDKKVRTYTSQVMNVGVKVSTMSNVEDALDNIEADTSGFNNILSKFKASLQAFSTDNADRQELAAIAQSSAKSVVEYLNNFDARLDDIADQTYGDTKAVIKRTNAILAELGDLNKQVTDSYINMNYFNLTNDGYQVENDYGPLELKDKINSLLDELSQYVDINVDEQPNGSFTVSLSNGVKLVENKDYKQLAIINTDLDKNLTDTPDPMYMNFVVSDYMMDTSEWTKIATDPAERQKYVINHNNTNISSKNIIKNGSLRGYLDVYNGDGAFTESANDYEGIEYYRGMINSLAKSIADEFNAIFEEFGFKLFTYEMTDPSDPTAKVEAPFKKIAESLRISEDWINSPTLISKPYDYSGYTGTVDGDFKELSNKYIQKMLGCFANTHVFGEGTGSGKFNYNDKYTFETFSAKINDSLGSQVEYEMGVFDTTDIMLRTNETARDEVMGVSLDEEGVNMLNYQKWYNAIARMTNTLDEALEKLINGTGRVGL